MQKDSTFIPPFYLKNPMVQTVLSSNAIRNIGPNIMLDHSEKHIVDAGEGVKLLGHLSKQKDASSKGLVTLLHGWEGSSDSAYIKSTGNFLYKKGYDIFRLNLRDHGDSHDMNSGIFMGTLLDETYRAIKKISSLAGKNPLYLAGFSMGANFAVRIARKCADSPITNLKHIAAVNPPLDPMQATINIDKYFILRKYFIKKWKKSLIKKQSLFPALYDFSHILELDTCMDMTEVLIQEYSAYKDAADYFQHYTIKKGYLDKAGVPLTVIMSEDDPVIDVQDFYDTKVNKKVNLIIHKYGGHCGYIEGLNFRSWYQPKFVEIFK